MYQAEGLYFFYIGAIPAYPNNNRGMCLVVKTFLFFMYDLDPTTGPRLNEQHYICIQLDAAYCLPMKRNCTKLKKTLN